MSSFSSTTPLSGAVIGLGMIGRHHARLVQASDRARFVGAVDPGGDRHRSVHDAERLHSSIDELLDAGPVDFAIVAVPTDMHPSIAEQLAAAGVSLLIEKPLAATSEAASHIVEACARHRVHGAVGHVERYNAALQEMRRRIVDGQLGRIYSISTTRCGPFPGRIRDVGVVMDLASHDIDLVSWLSGARIDRVAAQTQQVTGSGHEDLVLVNGTLESGAAFSLSVDWVSPTKIRRTRVLGEGGVLEADTLYGDLTFYENPAVDIHWQTTQQFRGVSEGNMTRYALQRDEPLRAELGVFLDLLEGDDDAGVVTLEQGVGIVRAAETVLESAATGRMLSTADALG